MNDTDGTAIISKREAWFIPVAIVAAGLIMAVAIYVMRIHHIEGSVVGDPTLMHPVTQADHIVGNPAAPVVLVEYSDMESTYSKTFQQTMEQVMTEYAASGNVAWVYRHLPLIDQHVYAAQDAEAAECAASLGGPNMFWRFIDTINAASPADLQFDPTNYGSVATSLGILPQSFEACINAHTFEKKVSSDFENGLAVGAGGSPFSILLVKGQAPITIDGAVPYEGLKKMLNGAIAKAAQASSTPAK